VEAWGDGRIESWRLAGVVILLIVERSSHTSFGWATTPHLRWPTATRMHALLFSPTRRYLPARSPFLTLGPEKFPEKARKYLPRGDAALFWGLR